ncbi:hypothetical protein SDC9_135189 [bioreactor metagenome]|uniref:TIGR02453 family protein n=1 Tax=bioreactor metagenome TaxID=1076179 RepID=A0A645DGC1_9ZZZZ
MFKGFSEDTIKYLKELNENNNKQWFEANRDRYKKVLYEPFEELVLNLGPFMLSIDPLLDVNPKKTISRINRDVRFSKDKSPYRTNMWIAFKRTYQDWKAEPTYFFEICPDNYRYGMGFYNLPKEFMSKLRSMIDEGEKKFTKIHSLYMKQNIFKLEGEKYKRIINPDLPEELNEWYQRKELYFACSRKIDERLFTPLLVDDLIEGFEKIAPIYNFLLGLRGR